MVAHKCLLMTAHWLGDSGRSLGITQVIRTAFAHGELQPSDAALLEMHGTGTALGDPIEIGAALAALGPHVSGESPPNMHFL